jgi:hypothetical protein
MELYRGDLKGNFEVKDWLRSRYGIRALFFTPDLDLARLYAIHHARQAKQSHKGTVYMCEINDFHLFPYDFGGKSSYSPDFRNMVFTFRDFNYKAALIKNVLDYPTKELIRYESSDIVVVYDFSVIQNLRIVQTNVWQP